MSAPGAARNLPPLVMGTAGHIDHGKTTLIKALTGTNCDRLEEEQRRGITIELGFARLPLPGGGSISVVDVPGHERFVRTMAAGASGIDFVLLVIAADEGVMPQTREHLDICALLGVRAGIVALTKIDAVDEEMLALAREDVAAFLQGSVLEGAPVLPVSARGGQGLDGLGAAIEELALSLTPQRARDVFRIPVDRVFTMRGHGTVMTGTMIGGSLALGDSVELAPGGLRGKVRGLQSHGQSVELAPAGRRTAVNVPDFAVDEVHKGDVLSFPDTLFPRTSWTVAVTCLASSPRALRHRAEAHFHHGARDMLARLYFADRDKLKPGESCIAEARFAENAVAVHGDRFVLRSFSPLRTVAGGVVLNPLGADLRRRAAGFQERLALCEQLAAGADPGDEQKTYIQLVTTKDAARGLGLNALRVLTGLEAKALDKALAALTSARRVFCFDREAKIYVADSYFEALAEACERGARAFHQRHPERQGLNRGEMTAGWSKDLPPKLTHALLEQLVKQGRLEAAGEYLRLPGHAAAFTRDQAPLSEALLAAYQQAGMAPPNSGDLLEALGVSKKQAAPVLAALRDSGRLVRVAEGIWYAAEHLKTAEQALLEWFKTHESIDLAGYKSVTGLSRKYLVALLEYFDAERVTMRLGDARVLRKR